MAKRPSAPAKRMTARKKSPPAANPTPASDELEPESGPGSFPIVGIGCSAGGLDALEAFFHGVADDCGMAFVVVQHLDPHRPSTLPELVGRGTPLKVHEA